MVLVLDSYGRPVSGLASTSTVNEDWGIHKIYCGNTDVTTFRGIHTQIERYGYTEPFWYGPAAIRLPQISPYDTLGSGALDWFVQGMNVTIKRLHPDGVTETTLWEGFAGSWDPQVDETGYAMRLECTGVLHQTMLEPYPPRFNKGAVDIGAAIADAMNSQPARRFAAIDNVVTGILTKNRGSWQSRFDYITELLATAYTEDALDQWTLKCNPGRFPYLQLKNRTTQHWTVTNGFYGVKLQETSDITGSVNAMFGEGQDPEGCRWRNTKYPKVTGPPVFRPLTWVTQNEPFTYDDEGRVTGTNPNFDPMRLRVARYVNFGTGMTRNEGTRAARAELKRDVNPGWFGTLELKTDPEQGSRFDIRAGQNIGIKHHHGHPVRLFHISGVDHDIASMTTTLTIDTNFRDDNILTSLKARNLEAAADPRRLLNPPRRKSRQTPDERAVFDCESGAGFMPEIAHAGGSWHVQRVPAGDYGQIVRTEFTAYAAKVKYAMGIFSKDVSVATLNALVGNPLSQATPWDTKPDELSDAGLLIAWGSSEEGMGYYPSTQTDGGAITGRFRDDASWDFISDDVPWLYIAFYLSGSSNIRGRLTPGVED